MVGLPTDDRDIETRDASPSTDEPRPGFRVSAQVIATPGPARYQRGEEIARGGLGRITTALDRTLERKVAIKELHQRSERGMRRFVRESLTTARLQHPAIVPVLDAGTWETGDPYLVMKLLEGKTLSEELAGRGTLAARLALVPNLLTVADALAYAHEQDVVHRDVKPANIMLGTHGETVLLDWGIAHDARAGELETEREAVMHASDEPLTIVGELAGTVRFMSPEQARAAPVTPGFDVYSLGVTIATVLSGRVPFADLTHDAILARLRTGEAMVPALPAETPEDLAAIVAKATAPPAERYPHAGPLADDLRKFIAGQLVSARQYTTRELVSRWLRRNRVLVTAVGIAACAVVAIAIVAVASIVHERNLAIAEREQAIARQHELVLMEARASLVTDPTAAIAWLAEYPATAPHQDEVLAMVDEAAARGVARHVWRFASAPNAVEFAADGRSVISGHGDGELVRGDLATGAQHQLAKLGAAILFIRPLADAIAVLEHNGELARWTTGGLARGHVEFPSRPTGLYRTSASDVKVTFVEGEAAYPGRPPPEPGSYVFGDDENDASASYVVSATGEVSIVDPRPRHVATFAPHTWVRSSDDATHYAALEPRGDRGVALWVGAATGTPPVELAVLRACATGEDRAAGAEIANDGSLVAVRRCGVVAAYAVAERRPIAIEGADQIEIYELSPDARWLALGHRGGLELRDIETGAVRELAAASTVVRARFSPDSRFVLGVGDDHTVRVWAVDREPRAGRLDDVVAPTRLFVSSRTGELVIHQHLGCSRWAIAERRATSGASAPAAAIRDLDDERDLWPWDGADDGRACIFAGRDGTAFVIADGRTHELRDTAALAGCMLAPDGGVAYCHTDDGALVAFTVETGAVTSRRQIEGTVRGVVRYHGTPLVLVERSTGCVLERFTGERLAVLPAGTDCRAPRASDAAQRGREAAVVVGEAGLLAVWSELAEPLTITTEGGAVAVSRERGLAAVANDQGIAIWDLKARTPRTIALGHTLPVELLAWSSAGILAAADAETVRLWEPVSQRIRVLVAPHVLAMAWSPDATRLYTTDGKVIEQHDVADLAADASVADVRRRLDALTSARIVNGRVVTP